MTDFMNNRTAKIATLLLFIAIGLLHYNAIANGHFHISPEGHIIYHAHPSQHAEEGNALPNKSEHHTRIQLLIYSFITAFSVMLVVVLVLFNILLFYKQVFRHSNDRNPISDPIFFLPSRRGPPQLAS